MWTFLLNNMHFRCAILEYVPLLGYNMPVVLAVGPNLISLSLSPSLWLPAMTSLTMSKPRSPLSIFSSSSFWHGLIILWVALILWHRFDLISWVDLILWHGFGLISCVDLFYFILFLFFFHYKQERVDLILWMVGLGVWTTLSLGFLWDFIVKLVGL